MTHDQLTTWQLYWLNCGLSFKFALVFLGIVFGCVGVMLAEGGVKTVRWRISLCLILLALCATLASIIAPSPTEYRAILRLEPSEDGQ